MLKPDDIIKVEMTALDACKLRNLMGYVYSGSGSSFIKQLKATFPALKSDLTVDEARNWGLNSELTKWAVSQFEDPKQKEIAALKEGE